MESKQSAPSVIARLMGLEELNPQQPVQKRQRVLSESYLRRVASIGVWEKHSFHARNSFRLGNEEQKECKDVFGVSETLLNNENLHLPPVLKREVKSGSSEVNRTFRRQKSRYAKCVTADKKLRLSIEDFDASEVIDSEMDISLKYLKESDSLIAKPCNDWQCVPSSSLSGHIPVFNSSLFSDFREPDLRRRFWRMGRRGYVKSNEKINNGLSTCSSTCSNGETGGGVTTELESGLNIHSSLFFSDWRNHYPSSYSGISCVAVEANEKNLGRGMTAKKFKQVWAPSRGKMLGMPNSKLRPILDGKPSQHGSSNQTCHEKEYVNLGFPFCISSSDAKEDKDQPGQNCVVSRSSLHNVSISVVPDILPDSETEAVGKSFVNVENHYGSTERILKKDDSSSSYAPEKSIQQDMPSGASEEGSVSSCCSDTEFESLMSLEDAYHPSPVSVLEPIFKNDISSCSENFQIGGSDLQGLQLQLEILKSELSDPYSEGAGMIVSSDEDSEVASIGYSEENEDSFKESREFSYMVDVFSEGGFQSRNPYVGSDKWHSPECLIDPFVFEKVEKKYAVQKSWKRSERMLLFDRINSGLMEMLHSCMGVLSRTKPVGRRFSLRHSPEAIVEELWRLLVSQEKQAFMKLSEQVMGHDDGWLDLGDEVEVISIEIEDSLIGDLSAEFVTIENL